MMNNSNHIGGIDLKALICANCGASSWKTEKGLKICTFCGTTYRDENAPKQSDITLDDDVQRLLRKCEDDPANARKYANLVLDIDPTNEDVFKYL